MAAREHDPLRPANRRFAFLACGTFAVGAGVLGLIAWIGMSWIRRQEVAISVTRTKGSSATFLVRVESWNPLLAPNAGAGKTVLVHLEPMEMADARSIELSLPATSSDRSAYEAEVQLMPTGPWRIHATLYHPKGRLYAQRTIELHVE